MIITPKKRQQKRIKAAFRSFSGPDLLIDYQEWKRALDLKDDFLAHRIFDLVDTDESGFIDEDEFLVFAGHLYSPDPRKRLELIFRVYDLNGDGVIDEREIKRILEASLAERSVTFANDVTVALVAAFQRKIDLNHDGRISREEFIQVIGNHPGIQQQFFIFASDWLHFGNGINSNRPRGVPLLQRLRHALPNRARELTWGAAYVAANVYMFVSALQQYADAGVALQLARAAGACLYLNAALVLVPMCRSLWTWVGRTPLDRLFPVDAMVKIHQVIGYAIVAFTALHVGAHLVNYWLTEQPILGRLFYTGVGISGVAITLILAALVKYSHAVKERRHEVFSAVHLLYAPFLAVLLYHGESFWMWLAIPFSVFALDALVRWMRNTRSVNITELIPLANGVTLLRFEKPKSFRFFPGDYLRLRINEISTMQWHPFTISAAPEASTIGVHIRNNGDWTGALNNLSRKKNPGPRQLSGRIDGPYGTPSSHISRSRVVVLIAAGIGVTPFASVLQSLVLRGKGGRRDSSKPNQVIYFHWLNRSQRPYEWFVELLRDVERTLGSERFKITIHFTSLTHDLTNVAEQLAQDAYYERFHRDAMTGLNAETSAGRPDWDAIFKTVLAAHDGEPVDVYVCGPPALGKSVKEKCWNHGLNYHEEKF